MSGPGRRRGVALVALAALAACGGERADDAADGAMQAGGVAAAVVDDTVPAVLSGDQADAGDVTPLAVPPAVPSAAEEPRASMTQPPAVPAPDLPPEPDAGEALRLAAEGGRLFGAKGCTKCHTIGDGYRDGPDLAGVTERRTYEWIMMMLTQPEYMVQADHTAQQLLVEHFLEMPNLEITVEEARAVWSYLQAGGR